MAQIELKFVDQFADSLDLALRTFGQGASRVSSVKDFVDQVLGQLRRNDCIKSLTLIGHGSPGSINVGRGKRGGAGGRQALSIKNIALWEPELRRLRCRFCRPEGEFVLIGCNTGAGLEGSRLLRLIVNFIRCCRARAPVEPVSVITTSEIDQIVEAIGEGEGELAPLPEPIEAKHLKTVSLRPQLGRDTLFGGRAMASSQRYDPAAIVGARLIPISPSGKLAASKNTRPALTRAIARSLRRAEAALAPVALYRVDAYLQLRVRISPKRTTWLATGALVGGCAFYSSFGDDTTVLYRLSRNAQRGLARMAE
jgi:hypothetical protein